MTPYCTNDLNLLFTDQILGECLCEISYSLDSNGTKKKKRNFEPRVRYPIAKCEKQSAS